MPTKKLYGQEVALYGPRYWFISLALYTENRVSHSRAMRNVSMVLSEPHVKRTCVAPSGEHCLTAVPYVPGDNLLFNPHSKMPSYKAKRNL